MRNKKRIKNKRPLFINEWALDLASSPFTCSHRGCNTRIKSVQYAVFYDSETVSRSFCLDHGLMKLREHIRALKDFAEELNRVGN